MATVHAAPAFASSGAHIEDIEDNVSVTTEDSENIPYHARRHAQPFTYGNLPEGFNQSDLNHVAVEEVVEEPKPMRTKVVLPPSPGITRKSNRPSISPSRPVLHKTPTRQEFEEMLMERREQAMREQQNNIATKLAQNAAIQKDLDELHERLNKKGLMAANALVKHVETVDLSAEHENQPKQESPLAMVEANRAETPTFPVSPKPQRDERCTSPYPSDTPGDTPPPKLPKKPERNLSFNNQVTEITNEPHEVAPHLVKFAKDSSQYWYKPHLSRDKAVELLRPAAPGTFIIRNSTTYRNAYGLVLRVAKPPAGVQLGENSNGDELVRHFLLEPTGRGVRLKGCANEPIFTSLSALVYQHSINQLALPCKLIIPERDLLLSPADAELMAAQQLLFEQGAACNVLLLLTCEMESLTGDEAIRRAVNELYAQHQPIKPVEVHFKVAQRGITLTDNTRRLFFRRHFTAQNISHFGVDPENRFWRVEASDEDTLRPVNKTIFGFVARPLTGSKDNQCHVFCDLAASQPASAIVSFAHKVLPLDKHEML